ncbi:ATP-binding protein [Planctomycetota bacterium]
MTQQRRIYVYDIPSIPDCTHHSLVTLCGGNVKEHINRCFEHLLRMVSNFKQGQIALAIRFVFSPQTSNGVRHRLRLQLAVRTSEDISEQVVRQLIEVGPLSEFYGKGCTAPGCGAELKMSAADCAGENCCGPLRRETDTFPMREFPCVCEIIRKENRIESAVPHEFNRYAPRVGFYYSPCKLESQRDNDFLMLDAMLSKVTEASVIEFSIQPIDASDDIEGHYLYVRHLMAVNAYGNDVYIGPEDCESDTPLQMYGQNTPFTIEDTKKKDPVADDVLRDQQEFHEMLRQPLLLFNIKVFAESAIVAKTLASVVAESGFKGGKYFLLSYGGDGDPREQDDVARSLQDSTLMKNSNHAMNRKIWSDDMPEEWQHLARICRLATVDELLGVVRLPIGGFGSPRCIRKATDPVDKPTGVSTPGDILLGYDLESEEPSSVRLSRLNDLSGLFADSQPENVELRLPIKALTKHMFVAGVPGSGKTTAIFNLLVQLSQLNVAFLVIEPAKTEYRILKTLREHPDEGVREMASKLRIYTPGNEGISPLRFNPLAYPDGITLDEHIGQVLACFEASMPMGGPLQALIAEAVEAVYEAAEPGDFPRMADLVEAAGTIMEQKDYDSEIKGNLRAAIEVRLGLLTRRAMGRIFEAQQCIPSVEELLQYPTIIEMDYLPQNVACLLTLFLLSAVREHVRVDADRRRRGLHHVIVIEEAHNIVGRTAQASTSEDGADPKAFAAQYISRMLAEMRALGEGIVIADQLPTTVAPEVVKNTGTKLAHRLVSNEDREDIGGAMLLGSSEMEEVARLSPGEAYYYAEELYRPRRIRGLNAIEYLRLDEGSPTGALILPFVQNEKWYKQGLVCRAHCTIDLIEGVDFIRLFDAHHEACVKAVALILNISAANLVEDPQRRSNILLSIDDDLVEIKTGFVRVLDTLRKDIVLNQPILEQAAGADAGIDNRYNKLLTRYNSDVLVKYAQFIAQIEGVLDNLKENA